MKNLKAVLLSPETSKTPNGYRIESETQTKRPVFVARKNVTRTEHFASMAAGVLTTAVFIAYAAEYHGEPYIQAEGKTYRITRTYQLNVNDIELTCTDEAVSQYEV